MSFRSTEFIDHAVRDKPLDQSGVHPETYPVVERNLTAVKKPDGLIHVSQLAHKFVSDAREVVKTGDIVKVKVLEVDVARKRISLTMKLDAKPQSSAERDNSFRPAARGEKPGRSGAPASGPGPQASAMELAFAKLKAGRQ